MRQLRTKVSGKRNRTKEGNYDIDLTNITDRVLAMSFPASKAIEKLYRNDINHVAKFLDEKYPDNYFIYNMSNKTVDVAKFHDRVISYTWEDHHSPSLLTLFQACDHMFKQIMEDMRRVVVVNCNAGKGRTGTTICCFLLYSGLCENFVHSIYYYGHKRFSNGRGVTQPS